MLLGKSSMFVLCSFSGQRMTPIYLPQRITFHSISIQDISAQNTQESGFSRPRSWTANKGTPIYMAPELMVDGNSGDEKATYNESVDIYSFGIMLWEIMYHEEPYSKVKTTTDWEFSNLIINGLRPSVKTNDMNTVRIKAQTMLKNTLQHAHDLFMPVNSWLDTHNDANMETYDAKTKELVSKFKTFKKADEDGTQGEIPSKNGKKQEEIPEEIRELWTKCWSCNESHERPTASKLVTVLTDEYNKNNT